MLPFLYAVLVITYSVLVTSKICPSLDVRNSPQQISNFSDCRVIDGNLRVVLMELPEDPIDYKGFNFSELYEIRDYLIICQLKYLPSLKLIFPKLAIIRGEQLFHGNALIVHDMPHLKEIGLTNLQNIENGNVRIQYCVKLCYVDTINWTAIGVSKLDYNRTRSCKGEFCPIYCRGSCWNDHDCQKLRKSKCHPLCIGCTQDDSPKHCLLCKYFNDTGTCRRKCPDSKLTDNDESQCLTALQCVSKSSHLGESWAISERTCIKRCPDWFKKNSTGYCIPSTEKICNGTRITSIFELEKMLDCTHIEGALEIVLKEFVSTRDLEINLGRIVSISDYLKIWKSNSITTLAFFKHLSIIKGEKLRSKYYSLFVVENPNLHKLFYENVSLIIEKGEAIFQDNPHLCPSEIDKINVTSNYSNTNGYKTGCDLINLNVTIIERNSTNVTLSWDFTDNSTVGYTVYYIRTTKSDLLMTKRKSYFNKCGLILEEDWDSIFVLNNTALLKRLNPYSYYSYYIQINNRSGHHQRTPIDYFRTAADDPSEPQEIEVEAQSDVTICLKWKRPRFPNGNFTHYKLAVYRQEKYLPFLQQRDYCTHPPEESVCSCPKEEIRLFHNEAICTRNRSEYCDTKTIYRAEDINKLLKIKKRSLNLTVEGIKEYRINVTPKAVRESFCVQDLRHYTMYIFYLQACNTEREETDKDRCCGSVMISQRTYRRSGADATSGFTVRVDDEEAVVSWRRPADPNSPVLAYKLQYRSSSGSVLTCLRSEDFENDSWEYKIKDLHKGNYSVRVWAVTLAGSGEPTQWKYFQIAVEESAMDWLYGFVILFGVIISLLLAVFIYRKYKSSRDTDTDDLTLRLSLERNWLEEDEEEWKLDDETVEIIKELNRNSLAMLYRKGFRET